MNIPDNTAIGVYLSKLIKRSKYKNYRQFSIAYLKEQYGENYNQDRIQNMQNRICQIIKGKKGIQIEDILIFSGLLGVSSDDILSAGTIKTPYNRHVTNYSIAHSKKQSEWDKCLNDEDKPFLNPDEYNKTVIDYALEAGNFTFLKYLLDNGIIWFVGTDPKEYSIGFGAGTSIERRTFFNNDLLDFKMKEQDNLRTKMITLALKNNASEMLDSLHARELPILYTISPLFMQSLKDHPVSITEDVMDLIDAISKCDNIVLSYFFEEYSVLSYRSSSMHKYIFPYAGLLLDALVSTNRVPESKRFLEVAISHNKKLFNELNSLVSDCVKAYKKVYNDKWSSPDDDECFRKNILNNYAFYPDSGFIAFHMPLYALNPVGLLSNIIKVNVKSANKEVQFFIDELNKAYEKFTELGQ